MKKYLFLSVTLLILLFTVTLISVERKANLKPAQQVELEQNAFQAMQEGKNEEAQKIFEQLHHDFPKSKQYSNDLGMAYLQLDKGAEAEKAYKESLKLQERDVDAMLGLSMSYILQDKLKEAIFELEELLDISPKDTQANLFAGYIYLKVGMPQDALPYFQEVLKADPLNKDAQMGVAFAENYTKYKYSSEAGALTPDNLLSYGVHEYLQQLESSQVLARAAGFAEKREYAQAITTILPLREKYPDNLQYRLLLANYFFNNRESGSAKREYKQIIAIDPENLDARFALASLYAGQGKNDKAIVELEYILRRQPENIDASQFLGEIYLARGDREEGLYYFGRVLNYPKLNSQDPLYYFHLGNYFAVREEWDRAEQQYAMALTFDPEDAGTRLAHARANLLLGKTEEAKKDIEYVLHAEPNNLEALKLMEEVLDFEGHEKQALEAFQFIVQLPPNPKNSDYLDQLGQYYLLNRQVPEAENTFKDALVVEPNDISARLSLAQVYVTSGKIDSAKDELEYILRFPLSQSEKADAEQALGDIYNARENQDMALMYYDLAIQNTPESLKALREYRKGKYYEIAYRYPRAEMAYQEALTLAPEFSVAQIALADIYIRQGKIQQAKEYLAAYLKKHPGDVEGSIAMGNAYIADGNVSEASKYYAAIFSQPTQPWSPEYFYRVGMYYSLAKCFRQAQRAFIQSLTIDPCFADARVALADVYFLDNQAERAKCELQKVLATYPRNIDALQVMGDYYLGQYKYCCANWYYQRILAIDPTNWAVQRSFQLQDVFILIQQLEFCKRYQDVIDVLQSEVISVYPFESGYYAKLGEVFLTIEDYCSAYAAFRTALDLTYNDLEAWVGLAQYYYNYGWTPLAKCILHNVIDEVFCHATAHEILGDIYTNEGRNGLGAYHYSTSLSIDPKNPLVWQDLAFICHNHKIDLLVPNCDNRHVYRLFVEHSKEIGQDPITKRFSDDLFTNVWELEETYYLNNHWNLNFLVSQFNEREDDLIVKQKIIEANLYTLKMGATWFPNDDWIISGSLAGVRGLGHDQGENTVFHVSKTYRFQPAISVAYENVSTPIYKVCPPPRRRHFFTAGFFQDTIMPLFWGSPLARLIDIQHFAASYEFRPVPPYVGVGIEGEYRNYKDPFRNHYRDVMVWARTAIPWWKNNVDIRLQFPYRSFNQPVQEYYSYKWQIEPLIKFVVQKIWCFSWQAEFFYTHGWRLSRDLINPLQTGTTLLPFQPRQFINTNELDAVVRKNMCDKLTLMAHGYYYWDGSNYQVYTVSGALSFNF